MTLSPRPSPDDVAAFIQANLPLVVVPLVPEIVLHRAGPSSGLWRLGAADPRGFRSPYWAYPWPGGIGLARHILDRPDIVRGRRVLDLGTGSGLVAIAAAKAGAITVVAAEIDAYAVAALHLNAAANAVGLSVVDDDLLEGRPGEIDVILAGDLFYERRLARRVTAFLDRCLAADLDVLVGDVGRAHLPRSRLRPIADYPVPDFGEASRPSKSCTVFSFGGAKATVRPRREGGLR